MTCVSWFFEKVHDILINVEQVIIKYILFNLGQMSFNTQ